MKLTRSIDWPAVFGLLGALVTTVGMWAAILALALWLMTALIQ